MSDTTHDYDEALIGRVLQERFEILEPIGGGGMGAVYLGRQLSVERNVAVKVLREGLPENARSRFMREARTVSEMSHPGIVQMIDFGTDGDLSFLVMELVDGVPLDQLLAKGRIHPALALLTTDQVASALAEAHARGVIHRDLKPGNILLTVNAGGEPQAKLLDFGIAYSQTDPRLTQSGTLCGTPAYMAPEQAQGRDVVPATDFYALGVNLYEMLSGRLPFYAESPVGVLLKHLQQKPPTLRAHVDVGVLPEEAVALTEQMLKKETANRPETARDVRRLVAAARASFDAPPLILEGPASTAFDPLLLPSLTENPNKDAADSRGVSFVGAGIEGIVAESAESAEFTFGADTEEEVPTGDMLADADSISGLQAGVPPASSKPHTTGPGTATSDTDSRPLGSPSVNADGTRDNAGSRAWAAFAQASDATNDPRDPARIDPNLWSAPADDQMAAFSENSIEFQIPADLFSIEPHDTQTRDRPRIAFDEDVPAAEPDRKPSAGRVSRDEKRPDWLQSAQESMEYEIEPMMRAKPNLPPEPEDLPDLPANETGESKFMSNILFILLTIGLVAGMSFIGMELFVKPVKEKGTTGEPDRFAPTQIRRSDDPDRRIATPDDVPETTADDSAESDEEAKKREAMKKRLKKINDIRYQAPIQIFESDAVKKGTQDIQDL